MQDSKYNIDMLQGPLVKGIIAFAIPLMFSSFLQIFFNIADTIVVGRYCGDSALAAVGSSGSIIFLVNSILLGLATGTNVVVANKIGAGDKADVSKSVHVAIFMALVGGIILSFVGYFFTPTLLQLVDTPSDYFELQQLYMQICFVGTFFMCVYNFGAAILRSKGDTKRPFYFLMLSGIVNFGLNLFMVIVLNMSVAGVAIATVVSQILSSFLVILTLIKESCGEATKLYLNKLHFDKDICKQIMAIGIPAGIQGSVFALSNLVILSALNSFNNTQLMAGNSAAANLEGFVYIGMGSFASAAITFTSQNYGAKNYERIRPILRYCLLFGSLCSMLIGLLIYLNGSYFLGIYTSGESIEYGMKRLTFVVTLLFVNGMMDTIINSMRGMGYSTIPTVIMLIGICGIRFFWIFVVFKMYPYLETIYMCYPISWLITTAVEYMLWLFVYKKRAVKA